MNRKNFLQLTSAGLGSFLLPTDVFATPIDPSRFLDPGLERSEKKLLADLALNTARSNGASYADVRIARYLQQFVSTREKNVQQIQNTESYGVGIRVLVKNTWGFAAINEVTKEGIIKCTQQAIAIAKANAKLQKEPVNWPAQKGLGERTWKTPIVKNAFEIPVTDKIDFLLKVNSEATKAGASFVTSNLAMVNEQKYFASTDGSYVEQDVHRLWPNFTVTVVDKKTGKFKTRNALSTPMGMGYEYLEGKSTEKIAGPEDLVLYRYSYDMIEDAIKAAKQAAEKHTAKSIEPGKYDLVLDPNHLGLTIHESIGHSLELDRVLGYEANYAGTSFATLDKWRSKKFKFGSDIVNIVADRTQPHLLNTIGFDDDGVPAKSWELIENGTLVNYQATRDQIHTLGQKESHGCCHADSWASVQFQRMPNVSLRAGKQKFSVRDMIAGVENGIYILGRGSYSIDQQRYNFQFGGQVFYEIKNGKITGMLEDVAYQSNTQEFWNSCVQICDQDDYRAFGTFNDGKGQPSQSSAVSHGSATSRFNQVNVLNTNTTRNLMQ